VAHACNPSHLGGRDQENHPLKLAWGNSLQDPILKIPNTKKAGRVAQVVETCLASMGPGVQIIVPGIGGNHVHRSHYNLEAS
jgi:hypothetical protein